MPRSSTALLEAPLGSFPVDPVGNGAAVVPIWLTLRGAERTPQGGVYTGTR